MSKAESVSSPSAIAPVGIYEDLSAKAIVDTLNAYLTSEWEPVYQVIPDEQDQIEATLGPAGGPGAVLPHRHHRRHRAGQAGCDTGGDRGGCAIA